MKPRKILTAFIILLFTVTMISCNNGALNDDSNEYYHTISFGTRNIKSIDVDNNDNLYYIKDDIDYVYRINARTNKTETFKVDLSDFYNSMEYRVDFIGIQADDDNIYLAVAMYPLDDGDLYIQLIKIDIKTSATTQMVIVDNIRNLSNNFKIRLFDQKLLFIIRDNDYYNTATGNIYWNGYCYTGEKIKIYDIEKDELYDLNCEYPISLAKSDDNNCYIYCFEKPNEFYIKTFDLEHNEIVDEIPYYGKLMKAFELSADKNDIVFFDSTSYKMANIIDNSTSYKINIKYMQPYQGNFIVKKNIIYSAYDSSISYQFTDSTYDSENIGGIEKIRIDNQIIKTNLLTVLTMFGQKDLPDYDFSLDFVDYYDEIGFNALTNNSNWDICYLNSSYSSSDYVKKLGIFYPLNELENTKDFLDASFDYVKNAAINKNGDTWMLPFKTKINTIIYNEENVNSYGAAFSKSQNIYEVIDNLLMLIQDVDLTKHIISTRAEEFYEPIFMQLTNSTDTDISTKLSEFCSYFMNILNSDGSTIHDNILFNSNIYDFPVYHDFNTELLYTGIDNDFIYYDLMQSPYKIIGIPPLFSDKYSATCDFVFINPKSKNIEYAKKYVEEIAKNCIIDESSLMLKDPYIYMDLNSQEELLDILNNTEIVFNTPYNICEDVFYDLLRGDITATRMAGKIEHNLSLYHKDKMIP